jgi:hypothetical protein
MVNQKYDQGILPEPPSARATRIALLATKAMPRMERRSVVERAAPL